jgi:hypothetical protein
MKIIRDRNNRDNWNSFQIYTSNFNSFFQHLPLSFLASSKQAKWPDLSIASLVTVHFPTEVVAWRTTVKSMAMDPQSEAETPVNSQISQSAPGIIKSQL